MAQRGAPAAREGYRTQALVALHEGLRDHDWVTVGLDRPEQDDPDGKADLRWVRANGRRRVDQVKMRSRPVSARELRAWSVDLKTVPAEEQRLLLVAPIGARSLGGRVPIEVVHLGSDYRSVLVQVVHMLLPRALVHGVGSPQELGAIVEGVVTAIDEKAGAVLTPEGLASLIEEAFRRAEQSSQATVAGIRLATHRTIIVRRNRTVFEIYKFGVENLRAPLKRLNLNIFWTEATRTLLHHGCASDGRSDRAHWDEAGAGAKFDVRIEADPVPIGGSAWWGFVVERVGCVQEVGGDLVLMDRVFGMNSPGAHAVDVLIEDGEEIVAVPRANVSGPLVRFDLGGVGQDMPFSVRWKHDVRRRGLQDESQARALVEAACREIDLDGIPGLLFE